MLSSKGNSLSTYDMRTVAVSKERQESTQEVSNKCTWIEIMMRPSHGLSVPQDSIKASPAVSAVTVCFVHVFSAHGYLVLKKMELGLNGAHHITVVEYTPMALIEQPLVQN